ncbi:MAG: DEAD/DEAH box helicase [Bacteroidales bacterium]|jgi:superfamily II DNA/RNA helicase|nr:DEAD/DEAH box helicase [Bacteroidales bacterium]
MLFDELGLIPELMESVDYMGFRETTPVQGQAIPVIMSGKDLIACAQTGTGKTAAFLLPVLNDIFRKRPAHIHTLILVPTRELAIQIDRQILGLAYTLDITSLAVYGGGDGSTWDQEKSALTTGADIIVATPGRLISHLNQGYVKFNQIEVLVLDEADRMLDIGFLDDIMHIISYLPEKRQTLMFSATMPSRIRDLSKRIMNNPASIALEISKPAEGVSQSVCLLGDNQKLPLIKQIVADNPDYRSILVFSSTKKKVSEIVRGLRSENYLVEGISSDLEQKDREEILARFSSRKSRVLVATDVLSRGIDIMDISMVINFDAPSDAEDYVHRVGRTARAEKKGMAVTLINSRDMPKIQQIEKLIGYRINRMELPEAIKSRYKENPQEPDRTFDRRPGFRKKRFQKGKNRSAGSPDRNNNRP